jgi:hypothetical protein
MSEATGSATRKRRDATWFAVVAVWAVVGYIGLNTYAMELGAAHHDIFCTEH